jgi:methylated-DNA-[protein]-cysteine S-methyltransferase
MEKASWRVFTLSATPPRGLTIIATRTGIARVDLWNKPPEDLAGAGSIRRELRPQDRWLVEVARGGPPSAVLDRAAIELEEYFAGLRRSFTVPLDLPPAGDSFRARVWHALRRIPFGRLRTYGDLAARAVGQAVGRNPLAILVPCHRVVGSGGRLTGFSAGLEIKARLLEIEGGAVESGERLADGRARVR